LLGRGKDVALVYPHLDADGAERQEGALAGEVDVGAQGLQRHAALLKVLDARHRAAAQHAGEADAHALDVAVGAHLLYRLLEHAAEGHALLQPLGDHVGHYRRAALGRAYLLDVELYLGHGELLAPEEVLYRLAQLRRALAGAAYE